MSAFSFEFDHIQQLVAGLRFVQFHLLHPYCIATVRQKLSYTLQVKEDAICSMRRSVQR